MADTSSVAGSYTIIDYSHQYSGQFQDVVGTLTLNSDGTYTSIATANIDGTIQNNVRLNGTFTAAPDGAFTFTSQQWGGTLTGHISSTGVIVAAQTTVKGSVPAHPDNNTPEIIVAVRNDGTFSPASIAGNYTIIDYAHQYSGQYQDIVGTLTLNSDGTYTGIGTVNTDGVIQNNAHFNGTFTVAPDGTFTSTSSLEQGGGTFTGHISSSGVIVSAQTTVHGSVPAHPDNNAPEIHVVVRNDGTFSKAGIAGNYTMIDYAHQYSGEYQCLVGTLTLNGDGTYTGIFTANTDGVIQKDVHTNGTFTVSPDGTFTTTSQQSGDTFTGHISSSGVIVAAQTTVKGSVPAHPDNNAPEIFVATRNDTAVYTGTRASHTITKTSTGYTVSGGADGTDTLTGINVLQFADQSIRLDKITTAGNSSDVIGAYFSMFGRAPETGGFEYWQGQLGTAFPSLGKMIDNWLSLGVVKTNGYPDGQSIDSFIAAIYQNVFNKAPDDGGYWKGQSAGMSRGDLAATILGAAKGVPAGTAGKAYIDNKITGATQIVDIQHAYGKDLSPDQLTTLLKQVGASSASIQTADNNTVAMLGTAGVVGLAGVSTFTDAWLL